MFTYSLTGLLAATAGRKVLDLGGIIGQGVLIIIVMIGFLNSLILNIFLGNTHFYWGFIPQILWVVLVHVLAFNLVRDLLEKN